MILFGEKEGFVRDRIVASRFRVFRWFVSALPTKPVPPAIR